MTAKTYRVCRWGLLWLWSEDFEQFGIALLSASHERTLRLLWDVYPEWQGLKYEPPKVRA
jgi:hypothetical protein